jgi:hypothetical protein
MYLSTGDLYSCVNQSTIHMKAKEEEELMTEGGVGQTKRKRKKERMNEKGT